MTIPYKLFARLTTSLVEFRTKPSQETDDTLFHDEQECGWPWNASTEQQTEWNAIMGRTRSEFEAAVDLMKAENRRYW